jgi:cell division protein FtsQ
MRALRGQRLVPTLFQGRAKKSKPAKAKGARAATRRRKPPPRWRRPVLMGAAATIAALAVGGGSYWFWLAGYPAASERWFEDEAERLQVVAGLTVQEVISRGRRRTPREDVLRALGVRRGQPILGLDLERARGRLEAIGWIKSATVTRRLPDTIELRLVEREPLALWQREGGLVLIGLEGMVITAKELGRFAELPIVVGDDAPRRAAELLTVLRGKPSLFPLVEAAIRVGRRRWNVRLEGGVEVRLPEGAEERAWARLAALEREHGLLARDLTAIDMRLPDRLVVRLTPGGAMRFRDPGEKT